MALAAMPVLAQVNTESLRAGTATGWHHSAGFTYDHMRGNLNFRNMGANWRTDYLKEPLQAFGVVRYTNVAEDGETLEKETFAHLRGMYRVLPKLKIELFAQKQNNNYLKLADRRLAGSGLRYKLMADVLGQGTKARNIRLYLGSGAMYEVEEIQDAPEENTRLWRSTNYAAFSLGLGENIQFTSTLYYQVALRDVQDYRLLNESNLVFNLTEKLQFLAGFQIRYDAQPPKGLVHTDLDITNGLALNF